jgi:hypothetical protein
MGYMDFYGNNFFARFTVSGVGSAAVGRGPCGRDGLSMGQAYREFGFSASSFRPAARSAASIQSNSL